MGVGGSRVFHKLDEIGNNANTRSGGSRISPRRGRQLPGGHQHTILPNFPKNCMKLKEFGPPGGILRAPLRSATDTHLGLY